MDGKLSAACSPGTDADGLQVAASYEAGCHHRHADEYEDRHAGERQHLSADTEDDSGTFFQLVEEVGGNHGQLGAHGVFTTGFYRKAISYQRNDGNNYQQHPGRKKRYLADQYEDGNHVRGNHKHTEPDAADRAGSVYRESGKKGNTIVVEVRSHFFWMCNTNIYRMQMDKDETPMSVVVKQYQTLSDIAIQHYGSIEAVIYLAQVNNINPTDYIPPGTVLQCPDKVYDKEMQNYCQNNRVSPATAIGKVDTDLRIFTEQFTEQFT